MDYALLSSRDILGLGLKWDVRLNQVEQEPTGCKTVVMPQGVRGVAVVPQG